ncbi:MAG: DUF1292 domain-containing protein [Eubacteriales bacterium]|nr:DUF1292 domain-containing protein [Eubacteriales bacterium]
MEKIQFMPEGEDHPVDFFVLGATKLAGRQYLLVTDSEDGDGEALILRTEEEALARDGESQEQERSGQDENKSRGDTTYVIVEDDTEQAAVLLLMRDSLEEIGIEIEL